MNRQDYVETMQQIHVPADLLGGLENMNREQEETLKERIAVRQNRKRKRSFYMAASVAVALIVCFLTSNVICYAATGNTWIQVITMCVDGVFMTGDMYWTRSGNIMTGDLRFEGEDGALGILIEVDDAQKNPPAVHYVTSNGDNALVKEGDRIYLSIANDLVKLDITEDIADGKAEGTFSYDGEDYHYQVEGGVGDYEISTDFERKESLVIISDEVITDTSVPDTEDIN